MKNSESPSSAPSYSGHVRNGVVVLDDQVLLPEGQLVRVELLLESSEGPSEPVSDNREERVRRLRELFSQWDEEDARLTNAEADLLRAALEAHHGLQFGLPMLD